MSRRAFGLSLAFALPATLTLNVGGGAGLPASTTDRLESTSLVSGPKEAQAAVSIQLSLAELVDIASFVVVGKAVEQRSQWEEIGGARRIVTYTRVAVERAVAGDPDKEIWVRTLGGVVGNIGQHVSGDAQLAVGTSALLFLTRAGGALAVSGMAQGHYPVVESDAPQATPGARRIVVRKLAPSPDAGTILPRRGPALSARELLAGATLDVALDAVSQAWKAKHASK